MPISQPQRSGITKILIALFMSACLWLALFSVALAGIKMEAYYKVDENGLVKVTETFYYNFPGSKHGIYRHIKDSHPQPASAWYKERYVEFNLISVERNGEPEPYVVQDYDGLSLKIGDPNKTITGEQEYKIVYEMKGALSHYEGEGTEFYWNVTGNEWDDVLDEVLARVEPAYPEQLGEAQACYAGTSGSHGDCEQMVLFGDFSFFGSSYLVPGEEMTIAQSLTAPNPPVILERNKTLWFWLFGAVVWFVGLCVWLYRWRYEHRRKETVIAQYEPLKEFKPMYTGLLFDNRLDSRDISAGIVYLAQQGFISIKHVTDKALLVFDVDDYEVTLKRNYEEAESSALKTVLKLLFGGESGVVGKTVRLSDLKKNTSQQTKNAKLVRELRKSLVKDLVERGLLEQRVKRVYRGVLLGVAIVAAIYFVPMFGIVLGAGGLFLVYLALLSLIAILLFALERRTRRGFEALRYLKGFKDFLSVTEKERYKFHNAPKLNSEKFMDYLPYAIAFGVEEEWAEVFKDIQIDSPDWYSSTEGSSFNAKSFATGIGGFSTALGSSTGSSSSGSSGGGSAGGGGGGGGGGSW